MRMTHFEYSDPSNDNEPDEKRGVVLQLKIPTNTKALLFTFNALDDLGKAITDMAFSENGISENTELPEALEEMPAEWKESLLSLRKSFRALHHITMDALQNSAPPDSAASAILQVFSDMGDRTITPEEVPERLVEAMTAVGDIVSLDLDKESARAFHDLISGEINDVSTITRLAAIVTANLLSD